jgi:alkaline phosphatase D
MSVLGGFLLQSTATTADSPIAFIWSGAITSHSAQVKARVLSTGSIVRLAVSESTDMTEPVYSAFDTSEIDHNNIVTLDVEGLIPNSQYHYAPEVDGFLDLASIGRFRTFPSDTGSFSFAFASCATTGSNHPVFQTIRGLDPLFFFHLGDFHYEDIAVDDVDVFRQAYEAVLSSPNQSQMFRDIPLEYIWDDHDFGPNNSDSTAPGRLAARLTYQEYVPHYPLVAGTGDVPIYHAFTVGRIRFIVCDMRSARSPYYATDNGSKTMMGTEQKAWFKQELLNARDSFPLIVWVNSLPWIGVTGDDGWYLYTTERREIANFIKANNIERLCMISGDAHMLAIDDGTNSDYATGGGAAFPVMHAAALDRGGSVKGGPYSHGAFPGGGQFGMMTVSDTGDSIHVVWSGLTYLNHERVGYSFSFSGKTDYIGGDTDGNLEVNLADIEYLLAFIFSRGAAPNPIQSADVNCLDFVDIDDVVYLINYVFASGPEPCKSR